MSVIYASILQIHANPVTRVARLPRIKVFKVLKTIA